MENKSSSKINHQQLTMHESCQCFNKRENKSGKKKKKTGTNKIKQRTKSEEKSKIRREKSENCRQEINQQHLTML